VDSRRYQHACGSNMELDQQSFGTDAIVARGLAATVSKFISYFSRSA
jgi:hypothetical protein